MYFSLGIITILPAEDQASTLFLKIILEAGVHGLAGILPEPVRNVARDSCLSTVYEVDNTFFQFFVHVILLFNIKASRGLMPVQSSVRVRLALILAGGGLCVYPVAAALVIL